MDVPGPVKDVILQYFEENHGGDDDAADDSSMREFRHLARLADRHRDARSDIDSSSSSIMSLPPDFDAEYPQVG